MERKIINSDDQQFYQYQQNKTTAFHLKPLNTKKETTTNIYQMY